MSADTERWPPPNDSTAFESLCLDLWKDIWQDTGAQKNGRSGQPQAGVDIFSQGHYYREGVQCKQKDGLLRSRLTVTEMEKEVEAAKQFKPPLDKFILAYTGPRDVKLQTRARELTDQQKQQGLFAVEVWSWEDLWSELYERTQLMRRIGPKYWPHLVGLTQKPLPSRAPLFYHPYPATKAFTGRVKERMILTEWLSNDESPTFVLEAIGGMGKSALAWHWIQNDVLRRGCDLNGLFWWSFYESDAFFDNFIKHALAYLEGPKDKSEPNL